MPALSPYLIFPGNCAEAMRFYERVLGGKLLGMSKFSEAPDTSNMPPGTQDDIMHAHLVLPGGGVLMASDDHTGQQKPVAMSGFFVSLIYDTVDEARGIFHELVDGGKTIMPYEGTFWAEGFGMLIDRFGVPWMVTGKLRGE